MKQKLTRLVESLVAVGIATAALVGMANAHEVMRAPRATYDVQCLTAKPGMKDVVFEVQAQIQALKDRGDLEQAKAMHERMLAELMEPKWHEVQKNVVTTVGGNDLLTQYFKGSGYTAAWFCGLISSVSFTAVAAADTMASHGGWTEAGGTNAPTYTGNRPALTFGTASSKSLATSSASSFTFTGAGTIKGMFGTTVTTKDGTTGVLYNAVLFTGGDRTVANTDVVNVSVTYTV